MQKSLVFKNRYTLFLIFRPYGTLSLLSILMSEVVKDLMANYTEEETWSWVARDILLDTWTTLLVVCAFCGYFCDTCHYKFTTCL